MQLGRMRHRRALRLALLTTTAVGVASFGGVSIGVESAAAQTVIDYDASPNGTAPLVLTEDTILHRAFQNTGAANQSGAISGSFNLTKTGWGHLRISGDNSAYSGTTTLQEGSLSLGHDNALGSGVLRMGQGTYVSINADRTIANAVDLYQGGWAIFNTSGRTLTLNGQISGVGGLQKEDVSTLVLNGANTYAGGTRINNGTVVANSDASLGSGRVDLYSAGTLTFGNGVSIANDIELTGVASINGQLRVEIGNSGRYFGSITERTSGLGFTKSGGGILELHGINTHTGLTHIAEGTLIAAASGSMSRLSDVQIDAGARLELRHTSNMAGLFGAGTIDTGSYVASLGYDNGSAVFEGTVMGTGHIGKRGTGTQVLAGDSVDFNGRLHAEVGTLLVNADFRDAEALVYSGATFGGTGRVQSITGIGGGTIAPGSAPGHIGRLEAVDQVSFDAASTFMVDVNAQGDSDLLVAGAEAVLGGRVEVRAAAGNYNPSTNYRILTAAEGISGTFTSVTTNLAFLAPELSYDADSVWLRLFRNARSFADLEGLTFNQRAVAPAAEALGAGNAVYGALLATTEMEARAGFDSLSGEIHATGASVLGAAAGLIRDALLERTRFDLTAPRTSQDDVWRLSAWGTGLGGVQRMEGNGNAGGLNSSTGGALFGVEADHAEGFKLGFAGGYTNTTIRGRTGPSSADVDGLHVAVYGSTRMGALSLRMGAHYGRNDIETSRQVAIGGFRDTLTANYTGHVGQVFGEVGYKFAVGSISVEPLAGLAHAVVRADSFTESGGAAALSAAAFSQDVTFSTLGFRAAHDLQVHQRGTLTATGGLAWRHAFDDAPLRNMAFASGGGGFTIAGLPIAQDSLVLDAGLSWRLAGTSLGARYIGALGGNAHSHAINANLSVTF